MRKKVPAILCDIDGLLLRGITPLPKVIETLRYLRSPLNILYKSPEFSKYTTQQIPIILLTNGGAALPLAKTERYNKYFGFDNDLLRLKPENVILNYSPLIDDLHEMKNKLLIISGLGNIEEIAEYCGFKNVITLNDFLEVREILKGIKKNEEEYPKKLINFAKKYENFDILLKEISGYLVLDDLVDWDLNLNIILKLLSINSEKFPIVLVHDDKLYPDSFPLPRMALGIFNQILIKFSQKILNKAPNFIFYGKPTLKTFEYTKKFVIENWSEFEISKFYMLGDNPETDILGGNMSYMETILVKTGVYTDENKEKFNIEKLKPKYIVEDFYEAIKVISLKEGFCF